MAITHLTSTSQLDSLLASSKGKVSVIDFHATWCGPCHAIAPIYESLAQKHGAQINFFKCDVDAAKDIAAAYQIRAMPTFIFLRGSEKIDQVRGADQRALSSMVTKYAASSGGSSSGAFTGAGRTLGGAEVPPSAADNVKAKANDAASNITNLDPQIKVLLGFFVAYLAFWWLG